ncbi:MAG: hypothetical protein ACJ8CR_08660 [Roseiflexaceae bacterium]
MSDDVSMFITEVPAEFAESDFSTTQLHITSVTGTVIGLSYETIAANNPSKYGNFVAIWQAYNRIPWTEDWLKKREISGSSPQGTTAFSGLALQNKGYIIGYAVGPKLDNICATAFIPAKGNPSTQDEFHPRIAPVDIGDDSVIFSFEVPPGATPQTFKHWVGVYAGTSVPYEGGTSVGSSSVETDYDRGEVGISAKGLIRGNTYTAGYFAGDNQTCLACSCTFKY